MKLNVETVWKRSKNIVYSAGLFWGLIAAWTLATYYLNISGSVMNKVAYAIMCICTVLSSISQAYTSSGKGWLNGLIGGGAFLAAVSIIALLITGFNGFSASSFVQKLPIYLFISLIGGIIGINLK